ncbi:MAG: hypothetical protein PHW96_00760 [Candidatus Nanoarchaeia archaeon]|nr:hypothetical protein [Candidatus Nanoarchaeia archaeon]
MENNNIEDIGMGDPIIFENMLESVTANSNKKEKADKGDLNKRIDDVLLNITREEAENAGSLLIAYIKVNGTKYASNILKAKPTEILTTAGNYVNIEHHVTLLEKYIKTRRKA